MRLQHKNNPDNSILIEEFYEGETKLGITLARKEEEPPTDGFVTFVFKTILTDDVNLIDPVPPQLFTLTYTFDPMAENTQSEHTNPNEGFYGTILATATLGTKTIPLEPGIADIYIKDNLDGRDTYGVTLKGAGEVFGLPVDVVGFGLSGPSNMLNRHDLLLSPSFAIRADHHESWVLFEEDTSGVVVNGIPREHGIQLINIGSPLEEPFTLMFGVTDQETAALHAQKDLFVTGEGESSILDVLSNDANADHITRVWKIGSGTVSINEDNTIHFTPNAGFTGPEHFYYEVSDEEGNRAVGTVNITVGNPDPVAQDDLLTAYLDQPYAGNVLWDNGNGADRDPNRGDLSVVADNLVTDQGGQAVLQSDGSFFLYAACGVQGRRPFSIPIGRRAGGQ